MTDNGKTDIRHITGSVILFRARYHLENEKESDVKWLTVERAHAVRGRRLLQGLLNLLSPLRFVLQSFLEFPLCLLLFFQALLNDCWNGARQRVTDDCDNNLFMKSCTSSLKRLNHFKLNIWSRIKIFLYKIKYWLSLNKLLRGNSRKLKHLLGYFFMNFSH